MGAAGTGSGLRAPSRRHRREGGPAPGGDGRRAGRAGRSARRPRPRAPWGTRLLPYAMIAPSLAVFLALLGYPVYRLAVLSFHEYGLDQFLGGFPSPWVGLDNYRDLLSADRFVPVTVRTVVLTVTLVGLTMLLGWLVALTMQRVDAVTRTVLSVALLLAWATPQIGSVAVFRWMFNSDNGIVPRALDALHLVDLTGEGSVFLSGYRSLAVITLIVVWGAVPFVALTLHAGLSQISRELYEAARVDGANPWQVFRLVTLPMLRPIVALLVVLSLIWDLRVFSQVWAFNQGGPRGESDTLGTFSYKTAILSNEYGQGSAIALVMVVMALLLTGFHLRRLVRSGQAL